MITDKDRDIHVHILKIIEGPMCRGSYMSAHVVLYLLIELRNRFYCMTLFHSQTRRYMIKSIIILMHFGVEHYFENDLEKNKSKLFEHL